jgi:hypothetical protein
MYDTLPPRWLCMPLLKLKSRAYPILAGRRSLKCIGRRCDRSCPCQKSQLTKQRVQQNHASPRNAPRRKAATRCKCTAYTTKCLAKTTCSLSSLIPLVRFSNSPPGGCFLVPLPSFSYSTQMKSNTCACLAILSCTVSLSTLALIL